MINFNPERQFLVWESLFQRELRAFQTPFVKPLGTALIKNDNLPGSCFNLAYDRGLKPSVIVLIHKDIALDLGWQMQICNPFVKDGIGVTFLRYEPLILLKDRQHPGVGFQLPLLIAEIVIQHLLEQVFRIHAFLCQFLKQFKEMLSPIDQVGIFFDVKDFPVFRRHRLKEADQALFFLQAYLIGIYDFLLEFVHTEKADIERLPALLESCNRLPAASFRGIDQPGVSFDLRRHRSVDLLTQPDVTEIRHERFQAPGQ